jgi:membrane protein DedA with SNARE-associated domain
MGCAVLAIAGVLALSHWHVGPVTFPTMVVLGPLLVAQYGYWQHRYGRERTTAQYLRSEPGQSSA